MVLVPASDSAVVASTSSVFRPVHLFRILIRRSASLQVAKFAGLDLVTACERDVVLAEEEHIARPFS